MLEHIERAEQDYPSANVLIVSGRDDTRAEMLRLISDRDLNLIGVATRAATALAFAAQIPADLAIIDSRLAGVRDGRELARRLQEIWGVPSLVVDLPDA